MLLNMSMPNETEPQRTRSFAWLGPVIAASVLVVASLYAFGGFGNLFSGRVGGAGGECKAASAKLPALKALAKGEVAALQVPETSKPVIPLHFENAKGEAISLDAFRGRTILLNLWATWCVPCRLEMPALDKLQKELGGKDFEVVAVNIDTRNFEKPKQFLKEINVDGLAYHADPKAKIFQDLKVAGRAFGMPTTLLIDPAGCELAYLAGPAEWASADAIAFVRAAMHR